MSTKCSVQPDAPPCTADMKAYWNNFGIDWTYETTLLAFDKESVQQSHSGSQFAFRHFNLKIEMQIGAQMRRTVQGWGVS